MKCSTDILDDPPSRRAHVSIPALAAADVQLVFAEMLRQGRTYDWVAEKSGIQRAAMKAWRHKNRPSLESLQAVLPVLGFQYLPIPMPKVLPPEVRADLEPIAAKLCLTMPETMAALIAIAGEQQALAARAKAA
jgi:hypothetical protein